jgi:putative acetyltransferase
MALSANNGSVVLRSFLPGDEPIFRALNEEWISRYFVLEDKDRKTFDDPAHTILEPGGEIFFALLNGTPVGCCALILTGPGEYEVAKMAVTTGAQGHGIGRRVLEHTVAAARALGATRLHLETNHALTPAIQLYESLGFQHIPPERVAPSPYARADVHMELCL